MEWVATGLSDFALVYLLSFWHKAEPLRERLGIGYYLDGAGEPVERVDGGGLGGWVNCPMCAAVALLPLAWLLRRILPGLGLALLLVRWFEGARSKARWWA